MATPRRRSTSGLCGVLLVLICVATVHAAELEPGTAAAYDRYTAEIERAFAAGGESPDFPATTPSRLTQLRSGRILVGPGGGDGIQSVPNGLIHHWRATVFVPGVTLQRVLQVAQDYASYKAVYDYVIASESLAREGNRYRAFLRLKRSAGPVTGVVDIWTISDYVYPRPDRAFSISKAACARQVEDAGSPNERRLPDGVGAGYLWRADVLSRYLERDGGVYVEVQTIGLSRRFPPLLGWLIEPIARRIGRGSAEDSANQLRRALTSGTRSADSTPPVNGAQRWCGE